MRKIISEQAEKHRDSAYTRFWTLLQVLKETA